jgi:hypothetical protein
MQVDRRFRTTQAGGALAKMLEQLTSVLTFTLQQQMLVKVDLLFCIHKIII